MLPATVRYEAGTIHLLDQVALPGEVRYALCRTAHETADAIRSLVVRGAPAIGVTAAFGIVVEAERAMEDGRSLQGALDAADAVLRSSRPTAVNLFWALNEMRTVRAATAGESVPAVVAALRARAQEILDDDIAACKAMGDFGADLLPDRARVLTHCNAGALATGGYGSALGVVRSAHRQGKIDRVFADETRPVLQGARLTAWELLQDGIPTTLITDSMAGALMARGELNAVVVGADRIAANGDVINKIGTYTVAVLARHHGIPFFVAAPRSTFDLKTPDGTRVTIEERDAIEVVAVQGTRVAPHGVEVRNPAFDVTPAALVTAIVCEAGVARAPFDESLKKLAEDRGRAGSPAS